MPYDNLTSRTDAGALMPEEVSRELIRRTTEESAALSFFRRIPVARAQVRVPVLSALPIAYWVNGDTGLKQTTEINWANKFLNIEEIAVIFPVPDNVIADAEVNIWDESIPYMREAAGRLLDDTIFFGSSAPASFPTNINSAAVSAGNDVTEGTAAGSGGYMADVDLAIGELEEDGFEMTGTIAATSFKGKLRSARASDGQKLDVGRVSGDLKQLDGMPVVYPMRGLWPSGGGAGTNTRAFFGQWDQFVVGIRSDISFKLFTEGVIQDNTGTIVYNLMQQDMSAMRLTFRVGWQVSNMINHDQPVEANRYPVSVLQF
ncbi:MAG TPA: phage major capsid protein [Pyrinomonadaceae bacterium]|nr:phage major capsid protein [Pyrinomonadaceae bacterium]